MSKFFVLFSAIVKQAWDRKKSLKANLRSMGLSSDPNKTLGVPKAIKNIAAVPEDLEMMEVEEARKLEKESKKLVAEKLEEEATKSKGKNFRFGPDQIKFLVYLIEKYGDDYKVKTL